MVRTSRPLVERMTLVWHDWFATSNEGVSSQRLMLDQNELFRSHALGPFDRLLLDVTHDPAMLIWLNGVDNAKGSPNENYGREMMELFTLGADRGAYTEEDVRQQARSLTGWQIPLEQEPRRPSTSTSTPPKHDDGVKRVFGKRGAFGWSDACRLCLEHPAPPVVLRHQALVVLRPDAAERRRRAPRSQALYKQSYSVKSVVGAILRHPDLYEGQRMVKPPIVHIAGLLRRIGAGITTTDWAWIGQLSGQQLFYPPNVAGWDDTRWLDTATFLGRWIGVSRILQDRKLDPDHPPKDEPARRGRARRPGARLLAEPAALRADDARACTTSQPARSTTRPPTGSKRAYPVLAENALRQLIASSPDLQTS